MYVFAHNNLKVRSNNNQTFFKNAKSKTKRYDLKHPVTRYLLLLELASVFDMYLFQKSYVHYGRKFQLLSKNMRPFFHLKK